MLADVLSCCVRRLSSLRWLKLGRSVNVFFWIKRASAALLARLFPQEDLSAYLISISTISKFSCDEILSIGVWEESTSGDYSIGV